VRYVQRPLPSRHALSARSKKAVPGCRLFEHDEEVRQAIGEVPQNHVVGAPRPEGGGGGGAGGSGSMDPMVLRALSVFERNVAMYVQRPDRVRELQAGLTAGQAEALMAALVDCYPLAVLHQGLERQKSGDAPLDIAAHILSPQSSQASESFNEAKVAELFRRLLGDFEAFKQTPHAYEGWLAGCTRRERKMIESLVSAFWDWPYGAISMGGNGGGGGMGIPIAMPQQHT
jgi:hypothetical protein